MSTTVRLLGPPTIERDGIPRAGPRGMKTWALLGYLVSSRAPVSRQHLAELLFSDAQDPMGALRWVLAELRRTLGTPEAFRGDPLTTRIPDLRVDVCDIAAGDHDAVRFTAGTFLDGIHLDGCAAFESWLVVERYRWSAEQEARVRAAADSAFAQREYADAVELAARAVALNVLDQGHHELLVRSLVASGDRRGALRQIAVCEDVFQRELGRRPTASLRAAAETSPAATSAPSPHRADAESQLELGQAAVAAGAMQTGIDALQLAVTLASGPGHQHLHARALLALGGALIHAVRGQDGEGATVLLEALQLAREVGDRAIAMTACRELGFVEVQAGRRPTAAEWLRHATELAETEAERAAILALQAMNAADTGLHHQAISLFDESARLAASAGEFRQQAWSLGVHSRSLLLRGEMSEAMVIADQSIELCRSQRWMAFLPWPRALRAEVLFLTGRVDLAREEIDLAWSMSCQLGDPCWEGMAARMHSVLSRRDGDVVEARRWLDEAIQRCDSATDTYQWVRAYIIDSQIELAVDTGDRAGAAQWCQQLAALAARTEMHEFSVLTQLHRASLGDTDALASARLLSTAIENPALHHRIDDFERARS
jgi:DNA-binding SARP family transcriptional activator